MLARPARRSRVRRLAGSDAGFLFVESPTQSSTCIDIAELGVAADGRGALTLAELKAREA